MCVNKCLLATLDLTQATRAQSGRIAFYPTAQLFFRSTQPPEDQPFSSNLTILPRLPESAKIRCSRRNSVLPSLIFLIINVLSYISVNPYLYFRRRSRGGTLEMGLFRLFVNAQSPSTLDKLNQSLALFLPPKPLPTSIRLKTKSAACAKKIINLCCDANTIFEQRTIDKVINSILTHTINDAGFPDGDFYISDPFQRPPDDKAGEQNTVVAERSCNKVLKLSPPRQH